MSAEVKICPYCKAEIRPLDKHRAKLDIKNDSDGIPDQYVLVSCVLTRTIKLIPEIIE